MRAAIRRFHSPDITDLVNHRPEDASNFRYLLQVLVGPADGPGEESFDLTVRSPRSLDEEALVGSEPLQVRHHLVQRTYDWPQIESFVTDYVDRREGESWTAIALQLSELGRWEFEGITDRRS